MFLMPNTKENRKVKIWTWIRMVRRFNLERENLLMCYKEEKNDFWVNLLEQIVVPYFDWEYITNPTEMPAYFFVPGFLENGVQIKNFQCEAGQLGKVFIYSLYAVGVKDIPSEIRSLMKIIS